MKSNILLSLFLGLFPVLTQAEEKPKTAVATLGSGCFWCTEAVFEREPGVLNVISGYTGGHVKNPTYEQICTKTTGHAEVTRITYDPSKVSFERLLEIFWVSHDPTTLNRQGNDVGPQYRSAIYYHSDDQKKIAEASKAAAAKDFEDPIVTEITKAPVFYPAEKYHQDYYRNNPYVGYSYHIIRKKLQKVDEYNKKQAAEKK